MNPDDPSNWPKVPDGEDLEFLKRLKDLMDEQQPKPSNPGRLGAKPGPKGKKASAIPASRRVVELLCTQIKSWLRQGKNPTFIRDRLNLGYFERDTIASLSTELFNACEQGGKDDSHAIAQAEFIAEFNGHRDTNLHAFAFGNSDFTSQFENMREGASTATMERLVDAEEQCREKIFELAQQLKVHQKYLEILEHFQRFHPDVYFCHTDVLTFLLEIVDEEKKFRINRKPKAPAPPIGDIKCGGPELELGKDLQKYRSILDDIFPPTTFTSASVSVSAEAVTFVEIEQTNTMGALEIAVQSGRGGGGGAVVHDDYLSDLEEN